jgi:SAM-dependent methyltransferase
VTTIIDIKRLLAVPAAFETLQWMVGAPRCHRTFIERYLQPRRGEKILDLGCGTGAAVPCMPDGVEYVGVDISEAYIERARRKHSGRRFLVADVTTSSEPDEVFDRALSFGVLHHIPDEGVRLLLERVVRLVKHGGRYATIDPCLIERQNPIARMLIKNDRGEYVRPVEDMRKLFDGFGEVDIVQAADMLNIPFNFVICVLKV